MAAIRQDGNTPQDASEDLRGDRDIVMAALKQSGWALEYASGIFRETGR